MVWMIFMFAMGTNEPLYVVPRSYPLEEDCKADAQALHGHGEYGVCKPVPTQDAKETK